VLYYFSPLAGGLPFMLGLWLYYFKAQGRIAIPRYAGIVLILSDILGIMFCPDDPSPRFMLFLYAMLTINLGVIAFLSQIDQRSVKTFIQRIDSLLGDISYPVFLLFSPLGWLISILHPMEGSYRCFWIMLVICSLVGFIIHSVIEVPVEILRRRIKC
jgi:peptidoglycan/LPS O-acetylase OafA/YrhL